MSTPHDALLDELWAKFGHIARERVDLVSAAVALLRAGSPDAPSVCAQARQECHKLVGSLDSYGRSGGSALAARAEALLAQVCDDAALVPELADVVEGLRELFDAAPVVSPGRACICASCGDVHQAR